MKYLFVSKRLVARRFTRILDVYRVMLDMYSVTRLRRRRCGWPNLCIGITLISTVLSGCAYVNYAGAKLQYRQHDLSEKPVVQGSRTRPNVTPFEPAFLCVSQLIQRSNKPALGIAVGDIKDYVGKYSNTEGNSITQGGALMAYTALGKFGNVLHVHERFDTRIPELELAYMDRKQLGDGERHKIDDTHESNWIPYFGGTILKSDYFIVGGITELNYNIASGGNELSINLLGGKRRTFTLNIAVDLRIVNTKSMVVAKSLSIEKQIIGEEVDKNVFRFFGTTLVDYDGGMKNQEPMQLAIRTVIEQSVIELVGAVFDVNTSECESQAFPGTKSLATAAEMTAPAITNTPGETSTDSDHLAQTSRLGQSSAQPVSDATLPGHSAGEVVQSPPSRSNAEPAHASAVPTMAADSAIQNATAESASNDTHGSHRRVSPVAPTASTSQSVTAHSTPAEADANSLSETSSEDGSGVTTAQGPITVAVPFDVNSASLSGDAVQGISHIVLAAKQGGKVMIVVLARDGEIQSPTQRYDFTITRLKQLISALEMAGIESARLKLAWIPEITDNTITRFGVGYQQLATVVVMPPVSASGESSHLAPASPAPTVPTGATATTPGLSRPTDAVPNPEDSSAGAVPKH